ncbi:hypothetical protein Taro_030395 [Colocasia esculenta]|uniref:Complex 1 LYR protein domain-containing protein n=1 Tax=Colocasia esculenta TaxID=4460 RepID=A0A843VTY2_COLES|nr:hypothetical protein [Colocasia esculenta]
MLQIYLRDFRGQVDWLVLFDGFVQPGCSRARQCRLRTAAGPGVARTGRKRRGWGGGDGAGRTWETAGWRWPRQERAAWRRGREGRGRRAWKGGGGRGAWADAGGVFGVGRKRERERRLAKRRWGAAWLAMGGGLGRGEREGEQGGGWLAGRGGGWARWLAARGGLRGRLLAGPSRTCSVAEEEEAAPSLSPKYQNTESIPQNRGLHQHNTELIISMVRQQFKKHKNETDPEKIQKLKDDAARGLINHILYESEKMTGHNSLAQLSHWVNNRLTPGSKSKGPTHSPSSPCLKTVLPPSLQNCSIDPRHIHRDDAFEVDPKSVKSNLCSTYPTENREHPQPGRIHSLQDREIKRNGNTPPESQTTATSGDREEEIGRRRRSESSALLCSALPSNPEEAGAAEMASLRMEARRRRCRERNTKKSKQKRRATSRKNTDKCNVIRCHSYKAHVREDVQGFCSQTMLSIPSDH